MVTRQLQVERRTGEVCRPKTDVLPLSCATQPTGNSATELYNELNLHHTVTNVVLLANVNICYRPSVWLSVLCQRTVVDADHRGGCTQIFGGKASEPETSRPVENAILPTPAAFGAPVGGDPMEISAFYAWSYV